MGLWPGFFNVKNTLREIVDPEAELQFDSTMPDGTPRKQLDVSRLHALGWRHSRSLREGLQDNYAWYANQPPVGPE